MNQPSELSGEKRREDGSAGCPEPACVHRPLT
jgi:hypothetical protein